MNSPHPIDVHVGERVRITRLAARMSQTALADAGGVSFQQVQKYEKGTNRISASRLFQFAEILGVEVAHFFRGAEVRNRGGPALDVTRQLERADVELVNQIAGIRSAKMKRAIIDLIDCLPAASGRRPRASTR